MTDLRTTQSRVDAIRTEIEQNAELMRSMNPATSSYQRLERRNATLTAELATMRITV